MKMRNIIQKATDFGTFHSRENYFSFMLKFVFYIIPAVIIGHYTDITIERINKDHLLGSNIYYCILLQTFIIISTLYFLSQFLSNYVKEFQSTLAGGFFIVLYFGMQTNYINMIKELVTN